MLQKKPADPLYNDTRITKLINKVMKDGKKVSPRKFATVPSI